MSQTSRITPTVLWSLPVLNIVFGVGLCVIHTRAENTNQTIDHLTEYSEGAWERIASGPFYWSTMDKILFFAIIMLALEILNFLCNHTGGTK